jgi:SAM-dependent methyltransferase
MKSGDLTDGLYWRVRQQLTRPTDNIALQYTPVLLTHVQQYRGQRLLELGASPGHVSAILCKEARLEPFGVDFSPDADEYLQTMRIAGFPQAKLYRCDIREFYPERLFDVVGSFGLVEHFEDPQPMLDEHVRLLRPGGLCIVIVPNFRGFPHAYHWLFDRPDLRRHNLDTMRLQVFRAFADRHRLIVHELRFVGRLYLWSVDASGGIIRRQTRRILARLWRDTWHTVGRILPADHPWFAPWLVFVAEKPN